MSYSRIFSRRLAVLLVLFLFVDAAFGQAISLTVNDEGTCSRTVWIYQVNITTGAYADGAGQGVVSQGNAPPWQGLWSGSTLPPGLEWAWANTPTATVGSAFPGSGNVGGILGTSGSTVLDLGVAGQCSATNYCQSTNVFYTFGPIVNNNPEPMVYQVVEGGQGCAGTPVVPNFGQTYMALDTGASGSLTFGLTFICTTPTPATAFSLAAFPLGQGNFFGTYSEPVSPCSWVPQPTSPPTMSSPQGGGGGNASSGSGGSSPGTSTLPTPTTFSTNQVTGTNGIEWNGTNGIPADDGTLQEGFAALYDATTKGFQGVNDNFQVLFQYQQSQTNLQGATLAAVNNLTNGFAQVSNRLFTLQTNLFAGISNAMVVNTNWLAGMSNIQGVSLVAITNLLGQSILSNVAGTIGVSNAVMGVSNAVATGNGNLSNTMWNTAFFLSNSFAGLLGTNGSGTNGVDVAAITNNATANMENITNWLGQLANTNLGAQYQLGPQNISDVWTDYNAAQSAVGSTFSSLEGPVSTIVSDAQGLGSVATPDGGLSGFQIPFVQGTVLNLDPDSIAPGALDLCFYLTEVVILVGFYLSAGKLYMHTMANLGKLQTGGVPNLMAEVFGVGGNLLGLAVHPAICAAIVSLWVAVLTATLGEFPSFTSISGALASAASAGGPSAGSAWYLLNRSIPVPLLFSLVGTRIALQFVIGDLIVGAAAIMRFFIGK